MLFALFFCSLLPNFRNHMGISHIADKIGSFSLEKPNYLEVRSLCDQTSKNALIWFGQHHKSDSHPNSY